MAGGCSSPQFNRIDADRELYESWPLEVRQAVLDGRAEVGMTPEMVTMALGKPTEIVAGSTAGGEEIWVYRKGGEVDNSGMMGYPGSYPGTYPSTYPGGPMVGVSPSIGISTGPGGTIVGGGINPSIGIGTSVGPVSIGTGTGIGGMGTGMGGMGGMGGPGVMMPMPAPPPAPVVEREVVFRNGVVFHADNPDAK
jgi:hypothetical protein